MKKYGIFESNTYMIPPALIKVGQKVPPTDLNELKTATDDPGDLGVPDYHHFEPPPGQMGHEVDVKHRFVEVVHRRNWVFWCENAAIFGVILLGERRAEIWVEEPKGLARLFFWQQENESHENGVAELQAHEHAPKCGMGSQDVATWELCDCKSEKCN